MIQRAELTKALKDALATMNHPVGIGVVPKNSGWDGQPNATGSNFRPYVVILPMTSNASSGPLGESQSDWNLSYSVQSFGVLTEQTERMADLARQTLSDLRGQVYSLGSDTYKVQQVRVDSIGGLTRVDVTDPPYWGQPDGITVWLTKEWT